MIVQHAINAIHHILGIQQHKAVGLNQLFALQDSITIRLLHPVRIAQFGDVQHALIALYVLNVSQVNLL